MKRETMLFSLIFFLIPIFAVTAQEPAPEQEPETTAAGTPIFQQGDLLFGGTTTLVFNGRSENPDEGDSETTFEIDLTGTGSYFLTDAIAVGPEITLIYRSLSTDESSITMQVGAHGAYHFDIGSAIVPYGRLSLGFLYEGQNRDVGEDTDLTGFYFTPRVGTYYFLNDRIALDGNLFLTYSSTSGDDATGESVTTTAFDYGLALGFALHF